MIVLLFFFKIEMNFFYKVLSLGNIKESTMIKNTKNYFYDLPDDIQIIILLFVSEALVIQRNNNALIIQLHEEFMDIRNDLWSYAGRIAFVASREVYAEIRADWEYVYDPDNPEYHSKYGLGHIPKYLL